MLLQGPQLKGTMGAWRQSEREAYYPLFVTRYFREVILMKEKLKNLWTGKEMWENLCLDKRSRKEDQRGL